jgi:hypothetical protein
METQWRRHLQRRIFRVRTSLRIIEGGNFVRARTGKMLAVFWKTSEGVKLQKRVAGKLGFIGPDVLDPLVVVMTILSIIEKSRWNGTWSVMDLYRCIMF